MSGNNRAKTWPRQWSLNLKSISWCVFKPHKTFKNPNPQLCPLTLQRFVSFFNQRIASSCRQRTLRRPHFQLNKKNTYILRGNWLNVYSPSTSFFPPSDCFISYFSSRMDVLGGDLKWFRRSCHQAALNLGLLPDSRAVVTPYTRRSLLSDEARRRPRK